MTYTLDLTDFQSSPLKLLGDDFSGISKHGERLAFNNRFLMKNGFPFFAVSGECHYSRLDPGRWEDAIIKMRMGGINIVSTYVFWNHIEEEEGIFDFEGQRDLRRFLELCQKHGLYAILRVGPFAHGEARNGGLPDWLYGKPFEVRHTNQGFLSCVRRMYEAIGQQVSGLFYQDGGPIIGVQLDNEYMHSSALWEITTGISNEWIFGGDEGEAYVLALREIALASGLTPVFFTGTAWGGAAYSPRVMPLWGGYAYWPWIFFSHTGEHPCTPGYVYEDYLHESTCADGFDPPYAPSERPYACCEMGGGMMCTYNYRFILDCKSVDAMANIKLGSGCNFIGYYMFHGGTHPLGKHGTYMNECQVSKRSYDYQAALGEFGQIRESYSRLKALHFFTRFFGNRLAPLETVLPSGASRIEPTDTETLRYSVRTDGTSGFLFVNNFQDHLELPERKGDIVTVRTKDNTYSFHISLDSGENAILPFGFDMDGIRLCQAQAQPVLRTEILGRTTYVFLIPDGMEPAFSFEDAAQVLCRNERFFTVEKGGISLDVLCLTRDLANRLYLLRDGSLLFTEAALLENEKGCLSIETTDDQNQILTYPADRLENTAERLEDQDGLGVYLIRTEPKEIPVTVTPAAPHRWTLRLSEDALAGVKDARLQIRYRGDIGTLFMNDTMISDNFCNGDTWEIGLLEHAAELSLPMTLRIAPLRKGARVNVASAMAGRNEEVQAEIADLLSVRVQPVYEIRL